MRWGPAGSTFPGYEEAGTGKERTKAAWRIARRTALVIAGQEAGEPAGQACSASYCLRKATKASTPSLGMAL